MIHLALRPESHGHKDLSRLDHAARAAGLTGAEIDAARQGRSFDVKAGGAIALALALASRDSARIVRARLQAGARGLQAADIRAVERETRHVLQDTGSP